MIKISRSLIPNSFTVGNMLASYMSVFFAVEQRFVMAAWLVGVAAFLDAIDGKVARITNSSSKFGVEYDSLADVVSFGMAPSVLIYQYHFHTMGTVGLLLSFTPLLFGSIRLARFNVQLAGFTKSHFNGLPIPAAAITICSYIVLIETYFAGEGPFPRIFIALTVLISLLMVSTVRYGVAAISLKGTKGKIILAVLIVIGVFVIRFPNLVVFPLMMVYVGYGIISSAFMKKNEFRKARKSKKGVSQGPDMEKNKSDEQD